ncbi:MAG: GntR family transcriptional regulator, transcriptional repressor for pyruvate dehydrogenase complex [Solirubrobacteraceae bacterium]|jgi:DNA-binding FadR family transcriptional regulator|nr:GntR family transcriptional regulator, transcriptional repressor for pyruvate dehydrogenase complex [Solirubrobacteraceae bacterium]
MFRSKTDSPPEPSVSSEAFVPEPVKTSVDQVRVSILDAIVSGRVRPGDRLPSELEQARGFRVSRTAVRDALRSLNDMGLIKTVRGRGGGSFVNRMEVAPVERNLKEAVELLLHFDAVGLGEILEARRALEGTCARLGARRRPERELAKLTELVERAQGEGLSQEGWLELDVGFHRAVARSAGNRVLTLPLAALHAIVQPRLNEAVLPLLCREEVDEQHRSIYEAIRDGVPEAAAAGVDRHLDYLEGLYAQAGLL